jgi:uncharacterized peroxidase-related enzyme
MKNGYRIYDKKSATPPAKDVLEQVEAHYQFIPNALGAMAESPEAVKAYLALDELAHENALNDLQRHVVFLTIAREYECSYCVAAHTAFAQMGRVALADPALQALHDFTQQLIRTAGHVSEKDVQAFLDAGYSHRQILDIITMIANKLIAVFANRVMGTDLDEALKPAEWRKIA